MRFERAVDDRVNILLVDDVADNLSMLEAILDRPDYCLVTAESGEVALDKVHQQDFAVIMLDVMMPGMSGFEVAQAIRQSHRNATTPIIFITAYAREKWSIAKGFSLGAADYLTKPVDVLQVRAKVDVFVEIFKTNRLLRSKRSEFYDRRFEESFLDYVTHEIRGPLASIVGFTRLLKDRRLSEEERDRFLEIVDRNGRELGNVIDDISDLARAESGNLKVENGPFVLMELLQDVRRSFAAEAEECRVQITLETHGRIPDRVVSDRARLRQIFERVIGNAIKFTRDGFVSITVKSVPPSLERPRAQISFTVKDTGRGMTPQQIKSLFRPFAYDDNKNRYGFAGTGFGLMLARQLARLLGGDVQLKESRVGRGTSFVITIDAHPPGYAEDVPHEHVPEAPCPIGLPNSFLEGVKILVVDDVEDNCRLMKRLLEVRGARVETAFNGKQAVEKGLSCDYDVILMDIQMPVMDGYEATRELRSLSYVKPIIAFTAHALKDDRERSLREGCDEHLVKPFDQEKFLATIRRFSPNREA